MHGASTDTKETRPTKSPLYSNLGRWLSEWGRDEFWNTWRIPKKPSYSLTSSGDIQYIQKATSTCSTEISDDKHGSSGDDSLKILAKEAYNALSK